jgi:hypothetical protein
VVLTILSWWNAHRARTPYQWLDSTAGQTALAAERRRAIRLLVDLAKRSGEVPDGHYIKDVQYNPRAPSYYAGFSDVHEAEWSNLLVVMKRLRVNEGGDKSDIHKVRRHSSCRALPNRSS